MSKTKNYYTLQSDEFTSPTVNNNFASQSQFLFESTNNPNLVFKEKTQRFLWKELMKIDVNYIKSTKDIYILENYLDNLLNSYFEEGEIQMLPEEYIAHLVNLLQITAEYLYYIQNRLIEENKTLNIKLSQSMKMSQGYQTNEDLVNRLKRENKEKDMLLMTYQKMITSKGGNLKSKGITSKVDDNYDSEGIGRSKQRFYCQFCSGKKFSSEQYLEDHMRRRHLAQMQTMSGAMRKTTSINKNELIESKLAEMKTYFETLIRTSQMRADYNRLSEKINGLENSLFASQGATTPIPQQIPINQSTPMTKTIIVNPNNQMPVSNEGNELRETLLRINSTLEKNNEMTNNKFQDLMNDMNKFKMNVTSELSNLKQTSGYERTKLRYNTRNSTNNRYVSQSQTQIHSVEDYEKINVNYKPNHLKGLKLTDQQEKDYQLQFDNNHNNEKVKLELRKRPHSQEPYKGEISQNQPQIQQVTNQITYQSNQSNIKNNNANSTNPIQEKVPVVPKDYAKNYSQNNKISDSIYVNNIREDSPKIEKLPDYEYDDSKQELDIFYNRFIDRDNEFSGKLRDYLIQIM